MDKDDEIHMQDVPKQFYDWMTPFHGSSTEEIRDDEEEGAMWIMASILDIVDQVFLSTTITQFHRGSLGCFGKKSKGIFPFCSMCN